MNATIRVPLTCSASEGRAFSQDSGRQSFRYFAGHVLSMRLPETVFDFENLSCAGPHEIRTPKHELRKTAHAFLLWASVQDVSRRWRISVRGIELDPPIVTDSIRWLYGSIRVMQAVTYPAADFNLTCEKAQHG